jgi:integrase
MPSRQHTLGHQHCPACEEARKQAMWGTEFAQLSFQEAAEQWLESRYRLAGKTRKNYLQHIARLDEFFGQLKVTEIHIGHITEYQRIRQEAIRQTPQHAAQTRVVGERPSDGASNINHEINCVLRPVLKMAGRWQEVGKFYEPLPLPPGSIGIALTEQEEKHFFQVAKSRPDWLVAFCAGMISRNTTASPVEIRHLRLRTVDLERGTMSIEEGLKNEFRERVVPLTSDALWALKKLMVRYQEMCARHHIAVNPDHYLLYHRADKRGETPDPSRPMSSWKKAHASLRREAGKEFPRLLKLRRYDFRHTAFTIMLEDPGVSYAAIEHMGGHRLASKTKRKYDHLRDDALRKAANALDSRHTQEAVPPGKPSEPMRPHLMVVWRRG